MASAYTPLGVQLMVTGEKAGLWGGYTNTNLEILEQIAGGYTTQAVADGTTTALAVADGATGATIATSTIKMTGSLSGASGLSVPDDITGMKYLVLNSTTGGQDVTFKTAGGAGVTWSSTDARLLWHDGTNIVDSGFGTGITAVVEDTSPQLGGDLDTNAFDITSASNADVDINPHGTGNVVLKTDLVSIGGGSEVGHISSKGLYDLKLSTYDDTNSGNITLTDGADGDIDFTTNGAGFLKFNDAAYNPETGLTDGATITWDAQAMPITKVTLTDNRILAAPTNGIAGAFISLLIIQDATGSRLLTWNAVFEFPLEAAPALTATGALADLFVFRYHNSKWLQVGSSLALTVA